MVPAQAQVLPTSTESVIVADKLRDGIDLQINGESYRHTGDPDMPLLWYLRDVLRLTGTKVAGEHDGTGADMVLLDGKAVPEQQVMQRDERACPPAVSRSRSWPAAG